MMNKTANVNFSYSVFNANGEEVISDMVTMNLCENDLQEVAEVMKSNGGYPVEMVELISLSDMLYDRIMMDEVERRFPDEENYGDWSCQIQEDMPAELIAAADQYVNYKDVDVTYYIWRNAMEERGIFKTAIPREEFNVLQDSVRSNTTGENDFDHLKKFAPEIYDKLAGSIIESINIDCIKEFGRTFPLSLREFPYQIYEHI